MSASVVDRLSGSLRPQPPYWSPARRFALWTVVQLAILGVALALFGVRPDVGTRLRDAGYLLEIGLLAGVGLGSTLLACRAAVPGRQPRRAMATGVAIVAVAVLGLALMALPDGGFAWAGHMCAVRTLLIAAVPWLLLATVLVRGAVLQPLAAGLLAGVGPLAIAAAVMRVICRSDDGMHVLVWHDLPVLLGVVMSVAVGAALFDRWARARV